MLKVLILYSVSSLLIQMFLEVVTNLLVRNIHISFAAVSALIVNKPRLGGQSINM